jgi:REP element-mobilizing transposase RayT
MQKALRYDPVRLSGVQAWIVGQSLQVLPYTILALAIMPNHVHAVIGHASRDIRRVIGHIKSEATRQLRAKGLFQNYSPWCQHGWNVYLGSDRDVRRAIDYVNKNPVRDGLPAQGWNCVKPFVPGALEAARRKRRR